VNNKIKKIFSILVVLTFLMGISTAINAFETGIDSDLQDDIQDIDIELIKNEGEHSGTTLLLGKYPVMTDRLEKPKTDYDIYTEPQPTASFNDLPSQFTWYDYGGDWTTPAKDQESCGSCWAFSELSIMEAAINIASGYPDLDLDLSEQYILSCLPYGGSCNGGWTDDCLDSIIRTDSNGNNINGVPLESCMPYQAVDWIPCEDKCEDWDYLTDPPAPDNVLWELTDWGANHYFDNDDPADRDIVKSWLMDYGPLSASMYATSAFSSYWNTHHDPEDWYFEEDYSYTNHAVALVGWKDDSSVTNGGFWRLKNSWGTSFGYNGFFNVAYGGLKIGDIIRWCTATQWPQDQGGGPGPDSPDAHVFADFSWDNDYPKLGDQIEFNDESQGNVVLREWDFDGDGIIDSTDKRPKYTYYQEGEYDAKLTVWSTAGLNSSIIYRMAVRELWPPFIVISPDYYGGDEFEIYFEGRNSYDVDGNIVGYLWDFDDGTTSEESYVTHVFPEGDRVYNVELTCTDNEGASSSKTVQICIDITTPPETVLTIYGCTDINQWFKNKVKINLNAEDWTGVQYTMYKLNNGDWQEYTQPFLINDEGEHTVSFYSVDVFGNEENVKSQTIKIDRSPPSLNMDISGQMGGEGWYTSAVDITLTGSDALSGLDQLVYKMNYEPWTEYQDTFGVADGCHLVWAFAVDKAGNNFGDEEPFYLCVDSGSPTTNIIITGDGSDDVYYKSVEISLAASDAGSGVKAVYYNLDNAGETMFTEPFTVDTPGVHTLSYYAIDQIDNKEDMRTFVFTVSSMNYVMDLVSPQSRLYLFGIELFPLSKPFIIGPVNVIADVDTITASGPDVDYVEFYVDGESQMVDSEAPYVWSLNKQLFGDHEIGVTLYGSDGSISESVMATLIIPF